MSLKPLKQPSRGQLFVLRLMIVIGLACIAFFLHALLNKAVMGYRPLYWLLMATFGFTFFKIAFEWYHYWAIKVPVTPPITKHYSVDIFTTFCAGEPHEMVVETLTAIQAITYPHTTYLCDEENDAYLRSVCENLGVTHVTRTNKVDAKAGNVNNALRQATGEICLILDPDHIPVPGFLDEIISHFDDPEIGFVQTVQGYYNQRTGWIAKGAAQQTYHFYGPMMLCMNSYGTVQAIGANCTFRRAALNSIGGHAAGLAEDMHTAMQLQAKGWKSVYVPKVLSRGLVPATSGAYYNQQLKWCRGVCELAVTSYPKLFSRLTWRQRLHYGLLPMFYLSGFVFLINFGIPVLSLLMGVFPLRMDFSQFGVIGIPFVTSVLLIRHYVQRWVMDDNERGFHIVGGLLLIGTWWVFILGVIYTIIRKKVPYLPTPKDIRQEPYLKYNLPNILILLVSIAAMIYGVLTDWNPFTIFMADIVGLNCLFMVFMLMASGQQKSQVYLTRHNKLLQIAASIKTAKGYFWLFRRRVYSGVRSIGLMLSAFIICIALYLSSNPDEGYPYTINRYANIAMNIFNYPKPFISNSASDTAGLAQLIKQYETLPASQPAVLFPGAADTILPAPNYARATRGVIYTKGNYWYRNIYPLTKKIIEADFAQMKRTGINTVKIYGPNIYDNSIFEAARQQGLKIDYSFWVPDPDHFVNHADNLTSLGKSIMETVNDHKTDTAITSWNIGNSTLQKLPAYYKGPQIYQAQLNYINWLKRLIIQIKQADNTRLLTTDVEALASLSATLNVLHQKIPQIDGFGLIVHGKNALKNIPDNIRAPYFYSSLNPRVLRVSEAPSGGVFYANWQDQQAASAVTLDGLKDIWGRNKPFITEVSQQWHGQINATQLPDVKILKPALSTVPGFAITYHALVYKGNRWNLADSVKTELSYEWYLVKTDKAGNSIGISHLGNGPSVNVTIPANVPFYKLHLVAARGSNVTSATTSLNLPLVN